MIEEKLKYREQKKDSLSTTLFVFSGIRIFLLPDQRARPNHEFQHPTGRLRN